MKNKNNDADADFFSDDPAGNLQIENEILHLKLKAELGGELTGTQPLSSDLENKFLRNILEFEHAFAHARQIKMFDYLGRPVCKRSDELNDAQVKAALKNLCTLMEQKSIMLDFINEYDPRLKYNFIVEEFFEHETDSIEIPGLVTHYIYEEFHPNYQSDIESRAIELIEGWLNQQIDEDSWELGDSFTLPDGMTLSKNESLKKINAVFDSYSEFCNSSYYFEKISFDLQDEHQAGTGYAQGFITYDAVIKNKEKVHIEGPFKIYLSIEHTWWSICYFTIPGFNW